MPQAERWRGSRRPCLVVTRSSQRPWRRSRPSALNLTAPNKQWGNPEAYQLNDACTWGSVTQLTSYLNCYLSQLAKSQEQLEILKKDSGVQVSRIHQADEYAVAAQSALKELQAELAAECMKTQELLTKAERLVILSSFEEGEGEY